MRDLREHRATAFEAAGDREPDYQLVLARDSDPPRILESATLLAA
jgi:hypothetical protein